MTLYELKDWLQTAEKVHFQLPDGSAVPEHFHVTEVGKIDKRFIDCGGTLRNESVINFQLWTDTDFDHRLAAKKLLDIIDLSEKALQLENLEIEVEYQSDTIGKYGLAIAGDKLVLQATQTDCLAKDKCGVPEQKEQTTSFTGLNIVSEQCTPGSGCC